MSTSFGNVFFWWQLFANNRRRSPCVTGATVGEYDWFLPGGVFRGEVVARWLLWRFVVEKSMATRMKNCGIHRSLL